MFQMLVDANGCVSGSRAEGVAPPHADGGHPASPAAASLAGGEGTDTSATAASTRVPPSGTAPRRCFWSSLVIASGSPTSGAEHAAIAIVRMANEPELATNQRQAARMVYLRADELEQRTCPDRGVSFRAVARRQRRTPGSHRKPQFA
jgi:hypothetical protein